jgi:hypothetical protein
MERISDYIGAIWLSENLPNLIVIYGSIFEYWVNECLPYLF